MMREVAAEFHRPAMLHPALKAFHPSGPPLPLLDVDTTWKFPEMYAFRDRTARELKMKLLVHVNRQELASGIGPFTHGSAIHTELMKTEALKQALDAHGFDAAFGGARKDEERARAARESYF